MSEITHFMDAEAAGDRQAAAELLPLVYDVRAGVVPRGFGKVISIARDTFPVNGALKVGPALEANRS